MYIIPLLIVHCRIHGGGLQVLMAVGYAVYHDTRHRMSRDVDILWSQDRPRCLLSRFLSTMSLGDSFEPTVSARRPAEHCSIPTLGNGHQIHLLSPSAYLDSPVESLNSFPDILHPGQQLSLRGCVPANQSGIGICVLKWRRSISIYHHRGKKNHKLNMNCCKQPDIVERRIVEVERVTSWIPQCLW